MKKLILFSLTMLLAMMASAQNNSYRTLELEIDPLAYIMKGYSFHVIYQPQRFRFDAGIFAIEVPESFHDNEGFEVRTQGIAIKSHYLISGTKGFYGGLATGYTITTAKHLEKNETASAGAIGLGPEIGYRFFLQKPAQGKHKGFYIAPWMSVSYNFQIHKDAFTNLNYKQQKWSFFPTLHLGYRF